jgi:transposase-like protein
MVTVSVDPVEVESQLSSGGLSCPSCQGSLGPWGWARRRDIRGGDQVRVVVPRRGRCRGCRVTHVLLPAGLLSRRADDVGLIGSAIELAAIGVAVRAIAGCLGRARSTVRGWIDRARERAERLRAHFTAWAVWLLPGWSGPVPAGSPVGDVVVAIVAAGQAAGGEVWRFASVATAGRLLCNTSTPFPAPWTA